MFSKCACLENGVGVEGSDGEKDGNTSTPIWPPPQGPPLGLPLYKRLAIQLQAL